MDLKFRSIRIDSLTIHSRGTKIVPILLPLTQALDPSMPNCDFYSLREDSEQVLEFVLQHSGCKVFEHYSPFDTPLVEFRSVAEVAARYPLGSCSGMAPSVVLQLLPPSAGDIVVDRVTLRPEKCNGATFRYVASGWGLIQLQLGGTSPRGVVASHTNHNSEKRAQAWAPMYLDELGPASAWDWRVVESTSRRINAFVRKLAVDKRGSRPILPAAAAAMAAGVEFV